MSVFFKNNNETTNMTEGPIWKKIALFALPIFWGNLFQQLYNVVDSLVVGNFLGGDALAAVTSSSRLIMLMVGLFNGIFVGAGVVISRYFGKNDIKKMHVSIHTSVAFGLVTGLVLAVAGVLLSPQIMVWMNTPPSVLSDAVDYLRIYFGGVIFVVLYNTASGIFQAVGDSRHPLYYLLVSSVINVVLDLLFVAVFNFGVAGAAWATIISQAVSAFFGFFRLSRVTGDYRVVFKDIRCDFSMLGNILKMGIPAGMQNSIISFANVVVQSYINAFGALAVAGCGASNKVDAFGSLPITSFSLAMTTFISQNLGAKQYDRAKEGAKFGLIACMVMSEVIGALLYLTADVCVAAFNADPEVIAYGALQTRVESLFYFLLAFSHCSAGILRGAGRSVVPMGIMVAFWCVFRVTYLAVMTNILPTIDVIFWVYPLTWAMTAGTLLLYLLKSDWLHYYDSQQRGVSDFLA